MKRDISKYRCIRFNLYDIRKDTTIADLVSEIKMSFISRAKCEIATEEYKRSENNMFVVVEVFGEREAIDEAVKESQFMFNRMCEKSDNQHWLS